MCPAIRHTSLCVRTGAGDYMTEWKCYECCRTSKRPEPCILSVNKEIRMPDSCVYQRGYPHAHAKWVKS